MTRRAHFHDRTDETDDQRPQHGNRDATRDPARERPMGIDEIAGAYDDLADRIARWEWLERLFTRGFRRRQFGDVTGRVLDVACGTGPNFRHLPADVDLVGVDISTEMLEKARAELDRLGRDGTLQRMDAQDLAFEDDSFDAVVSSFSTCTFPDPVAALQEMGRVCKPNGRIVLLEHGRSDVGPLARFQHWRAESHYETAGCRWDQEPLALVERAGLTVAEARTALLGIVTAVEARPGGGQRETQARRTEQRVFQGR